MSNDNAVYEKNDTVGNSQRILDVLWLCTGGGFIGEAIGIIAARWYLATWMIWAGAAIGVCLGILPICFPSIGKAAASAVRFLIVWTFSCLLQVLKGLKQLAFQRQELTVDVLKQRMSQYGEQRRWIAYENILRRFLANNPVNSPELAVRVCNVTKRFEYCRSQFSFLIWYITGGFIFVVVSFRLLQSQANFPELLVKVLPFLNDWLDNAWLGIVANGLLVAVWFILVSFVTNILYLFLRKKMIYRGSGWVVFACFLLIAFPLIQFGLGKLTEVDAVMETAQKIPQGEKVFPVVVSFLPSAQYYLIALSMLMFLRSLVLNTVINGMSQTKPMKMSLLVWVALLILTAKLPFGLYLPESACFCVLLATTGMLNSKLQTHKHRWSWLLVPFCCFFAVVLNLALESNTAVLLAVGAALFIGGLLIVPEKTFHSLIVLAIYATTVAFIGYFLRRSIKEPDIALTLIAVWSSVNLWQLLTHLDQFNARFSVLDGLQRFILRKHLRNTEFSKESLLDTEWYQANSKQATVPPKSPGQQAIPVPIKKH